MEIDSARPGERWTVRRRLPDGSATDLLGWIEQLTPTQVQLRTRDGHRHDVDRALVLAARRAPAARGGPPAARVSAAELERIALPGWLAEHEPLGQWSLRAAGGFTGRANSCLAVGDPGVPMPAAAERIVAFSAQHGIAPRAQVVRGSAEEAALRRLGWTETYVPTDVLAARLSELLGMRPPDPRVQVTEALSQDWEHAYQRSRPTSTDPEVVHRILDGTPPRAFAGAPALQARDQTAPPRSLICIARGHRSSDWLGLTSIWTSPEHRRRGWATAAAVTLGHWAARAGARYAYLQVDAANTAAISAYGRLGFRRHHSYLYLAPADS